MKILFTSRKTLFSQPGGDTQQIVQTAEHLRQLGISVDIILRGEKVDLGKYNLIHFFNLGRPADLEDKLLNANIPLVISTIWVDYSEYDSLRKDFIGTLKSSFNQHKIEYAKTLARAIKGTDASPEISYLTKGHFGRMQQLINKANALICSSNSEANRVQCAFKVSKKPHVIPLGLSPEFLVPAPQNTARKGVISVGRIEGLKNQLNLIKAANNKPWELQIIGKPAQNQHAYFEACKQAAAKNVNFTGWLGGSKLLEAYQNAQILVLPSYFETFGLVALEAMSQGCHIVLADRPDMNQIFADHAFFCNPNDPNDIAEKINLALQKPPKTLSENYLNQHSWHTIATVLKTKYEAVLTTH